MKNLIGLLLAVVVSVSSFAQGSNKENYKESAFGIEIPMIYVKGGEFLMGGTSEQGKEAEKDETVHRVTVGDFYIGQFEITQAQWEAVMETGIVQQARKAGVRDKYNGVGPNYPMYFVTWEEAMEFCRILSRKTGRKYTLPTEAEWEYAARGGQKTENTKYSGSNLIDPVAWHSRGAAHPVGQKEPNQLDIYDMSGNVWEWCYDWYGSYAGNGTLNPNGPSTGEERVLRGGSWHNPASRCRVSYRGHNSPERRASYRGFRIVCHLEPGEE